jgi:hypothetical protein
VSTEPGQLHDLECTIDLNGFFGIQPIRPGLRDVTLSYRVASDADEATLQEILDAARSLPHRTEGPPTLAPRHLSSPSDEPRKRDWNVGGGARPLMAATNDGRTSTRLVAMNASTSVGSRRTCRPTLT